MPKTLQQLAALLAALFCVAPAHAAIASGRVIDAATGQPIAGAIVTLQRQVAQTGKDGLFQAECAGDRLLVRAPGYLRHETGIDCQKGEDREIRLTPFTPKALYLSFFGIGNTALRQAALDLIAETELNALVIDVKGDRGLIAYKSAIPLPPRPGHRKSSPSATSAACSPPCARKASTPSPGSWFSRTTRSPRRDRTGR